MTSCKTVNEDSLRDAYGKGLIDQDPRYHPLIMTGSTVTKVSKSKEYFELLQKKASEWFSKLTKNCTYVHIYLYKSIYKMYINIRSV